MAYTITKTNGDVLTTVPDTELNTEYGITLVGRNYSGYGLYLNDNFVRLIENFADATAPAIPVSGQLWFSTTTKELSVWEGSTWKNVAYISDAGTEPGATGRQIGDLWWDNVNYQLKLWSGLSTNALSATQTSEGTELQITSTANLAVGDTVTHSNIALSEEVMIEQILSSTNVRITSSQPVGNGETVTFTRGSGWYVVGPNYTKGQMLSGVIPATIIDTNAVSHVVDLVYIKGRVSSIFSRDVEFTPAVDQTIEGFGTIKPGVNLHSTGSIQKAKTVTANAVGSLGQTTIQLSSVDDLLMGDYFTSSAVSIGAGASILSIFTSNSSVTITTATSVTEDEVVTFQRGADVAYLYHGTVTNAQKLDNVSPDNFARKDRTETFEENLIVTGTVTALDSKLQVTNSDNDVHVSNTVRDGNIAITANVAGISNNTVALRINGLNGLVEVLANPTADLGVATKQYIDADIAVVRSQLAANVALLIGTGAPEDRQNFGALSHLANATIASIEALSTEVDLKAYTNNPALTGVPTAPTAVTGTNTNQLATTEFVQTANAALQSEQLVITNNLMAIKANIASPSFTGVPTAPTAPAGTANSMIATTSFVASQSPVLSVVGKTGVVTLGVADITGAAPTANPTFTGVPAAPTANASTRTTQVATTAFVHSVMPTGIVMMWSGSSASIPYGWALCNGSNGTPDLRNRFVVGAGSTYANAATGGGTIGNVTVSTAPAHTHSGYVGNTTLTIAQIPAHTHDIWGGNDANNSPQLLAPVLNYDDAERIATDPLSIRNTGGGQPHRHTIGSDGSHTHTVTGTWLPPYYALCYIMKVI